jgi:hypothetical protein
MPKGKTKTSLIKAKNTGAVPAICISKPPGIGCLLQKYACDGKFAGILQPPADTLQGCQAAAADETNCKIVMVWNNTGQKQFIVEDFDNCGTPPLPKGLWNMETAKTPGGDDDNVWQGGFIPGIVVVVSDEYGFLFCIEEGTEYRFNTRLIDGWQSTILYQGTTGNPYTEYPGHIGGTWEAVESCEP